MHRPIGLTCIIFVITLIGLAFGLDGSVDPIDATDVAQTTRILGVDLLRGVRLVCLGLLLFFTLPGLAVIEPSIRNGEATWQGIHRELTRLTKALAVIIGLALGTELLFFGQQPALFLGFCLLIFWLVVLLGVIVVVILASGEKFIFSFESTGTYTPVFKRVTSGIAHIDVEVTVRTSKSSHSPVTVNIDKVIVKSAPGQSGNVNTDVGAQLTFNAQGTTAPDATGSKVSGFGQPIVQGVSEIHVTATATCSQGHTGTGTYVGRYQK